MMTRNGRRSSEARAAPVEMINPVVKKTVTGSKRRALGDITNAVTSEESKENASKKPASQAARIPGIRMIVENIVPDERDYMRRDSDDIDARDKGNPLLATCYVNEMYQNFGVLENQFSVSPSYMSTQTHINERMRSILIDWLVSSIKRLQIDYDLQIQYDFLIIRSCLLTCNYNTRSMFT